MRKASLSSKKLAKKIAVLVSDKKAEDIVVLDMRKLVNFCDYFVLCSATNERQVSAIARHIEEELDKLGIKSPLNDKQKKKEWVVFDSGDVIVHIFHKEKREFYNLDYLWKEAKKVPWDENES